MPEPAVAVLGEARVISDLVVDGQADEPAVQQAVANLFHQLALAAHGEQDLDEHCAQQILGRDGGAAGVGVDGVKQATEATRASLISDVRCAMAGL